MSWIFHGLVSGSRMLASNRGSGTGWKFLRPAEVIAGFLVFAKSGLILSLRILSITDQKVAFVSGFVAVAEAKVSSRVVAHVNTFCVVHASSVDEKLANAMTTSAALSALDIGSESANKESTARAILDLS